MPDVIETIDRTLETFIAAQHVYFVATAPLSGDGHINLSPKGLDTLRVLGPRTLAYLDYVGSGAETIAHLMENGRIVVMFCAMTGPPRIVRCHGRGRVFDPHTTEYARLRPQFPPVPEGRAIIVVSLDRISQSCGYGVPLYEFAGDRPQLPAWAARKGAEGLRAYQTDNNARSIDGLPAVTWVQAASTGEEEIRNA